MLDLLCLCLRVGLRLDVLDVHLVQDSSCSGGIGGGRVALPHTLLLLLLLLELQHAQLCKEAVQVSLLLLLLLGLHLSLHLLLLE